LNAVIAAAGNTEITLREACLEGNSYLVVIFRVELKTLVKNIIRVICKPVFKEIDSVEGKQTTLKHILRLKSAVMPKHGCEGV